VHLAPRPRPPAVPAAAPADDSFSLPTGLTDSRAPEPLDATAASSLHHQEDHLHVASARCGGSVVKRPWLGAKLQTVTPDRDSLSLNRHWLRSSSSITAAEFPAGPVTGCSLAIVSTSVDGQGTRILTPSDYRFATKRARGVASLAFCAGRDTKLAIALETRPDTARDYLSSNRARLSSWPRSPIFYAGRRMNCG